MAQKKYNHIAKKVRSVAAAHEAGHALVAWFSHSIYDVQSTEILEDGGVTICARADGKHPLVLWEYVCIDLAGIAAELLCFKTVRARTCRSDLNAAHGRAELIAARAKPPLFGCVWADDPPKPTLAIADMFKRRPSKHAASILERAYRHARWMISSNAAFGELRKQLFIRGRLEQADLHAILGNRPPLMPFVPT